ncbi:MAG: Rnf-Nqr domain containing protein [Huintestinicola sp.]
MAKKEKWSFSQGILPHNPLLTAGMLAAPAAVFANTAANAVSFAAVFSAVTFISLMISSFVPKKIPYALRIILYTLCAATVYIPVYNIFSGIIPVSYSQMGVFGPMIVTASFIVSATELRFFRYKKVRMTADVISHIIGYDIVIILLGYFRELFSQGGIGNTLYGVDLVIPGLAAPYAGFILIGLLAAAVRLFTGNRAGSENNERK